MGRLSSFPPDRCAIGRAAGGRCDPDECPAPCGAGGSSADNTPVSLFRVLAPAADAGSVSVNACLIFGARRRSEEHTSELQSLMRISYAVFCLKKKNKNNHNHDSHTIKTDRTTKHQTAIYNNTYK